MTNLKKSLIVLITIGNMQQLVPMVETTTSPRPGNNHRGASNNIRYSNAPSPERSNLGSHGGSIFRGITIYSDGSTVKEDGVEDGVKGLYDRESKMANIDGHFYIVTTEHTPKNTGTQIPTKIGGHALIAYFDNDSSAHKSGGLGRPNTRTYLYGNQIPSNVVS